MKNKKVIIIIIILAVLVYLSPLLLVLFASLLTGPVEYKEVNNKKVIVEKYGVELEIKGEYYDEESKCYVLETVVNKKKDKKYSEADSLDFTYIFKDKDNYVLGTANLYLDDMDSNNKWKKNISYCDDYSSDVKSYKIKEVEKY